ncbi:MAG: tetratricopeptide repeat protein [Deltaproteobacteria bacterium]|nr:tetratricopeptide repeat protein [Deltaproteobacteria bacterium]
MWFKILFLLLLFCVPLWGEEGEGSLKDLNQKVQVELESSHRLAGEGKIDEAIKKLQDLLKEAPSQSYLIRIQYDLANLLFLQGRYPEARAAYYKVIMLNEDQKQMVARAQERIEKMKEREARKGDQVAIRLIDIETTLDAGQFPPAGTIDFLKEIESQPTHLSFEKAHLLRARIVDMENKKALEILNEARQLFDQKKDYGKILALLETIVQEFPNTDEMPSVQILMEETRKRLSRRQH